MLLTPSSDIRKWKYKYEHRTTTYIIERCQRHQDAVERVSDARRETISDYPISYIPFARHVLFGAVSGLRHIAEDV